MSIDKIKEMAALDYTAEEIADELGFTKSRVSSICSRYRISTVRKHKNKGGVTTNELLSIKINDAKNLLVENGYSIIKKQDMLKLLK